MSWPFLYFTDDRLSEAELTSARLDGDLVEVGDAYMPADAVETAQLRAASVRERVPEALALTRESAAWIHGALCVAPARHSVQRRRVLRLHQVVDARLNYRDQLLPRGAAVRIGGVWVTTLERTVGDLVRAMCAGEDASVHVEAILQWRPGLAAATLEALRQGPGVHFKRPAMEFLRARAAQAQAQDEVTRYTS